MFSLKYVYTATQLSYFISVPFIRILSCWDLKLQRRLLSLRIVTYEMIKGVDYKKHIISFTANAIIPISTPHGPGC